MENKEDMESVVRLVRETYRLQKIQLCYHNIRGYHLVVPRKELDKDPLPKEFILVDKRQKVYHFSIDELERLNMLFHETLSEIWFETASELGSLVLEVFQPTNLMALYTLCDNAALLDCLTSFVTYSSMCPIPMARPRFTDGGPVVLKRAHHPILLRLNPGTSVPNSVFLCESSCLHIITGHNQAGKSTYIRMVGTTVILAHTGCCVPAQMALIPLIRRIATRLSSNDDLLQNESHFSREMRDVSTIFSAVHPTKEISSRQTSEQNRRRTRQSSDMDRATTLVLVDELGRATSTVEGFSIAWAVAEDLSKIPNVLTLFTTHFHGLGAMAFVNPTVQTFHLEAVPQLDNSGDDKGQNTNNGKEPVRTDKRQNFKFTYRVRDGNLIKTSYGIKVARAAGFPERVAHAAERMRDRAPVRSIQTAEAVLQNLIQLTDEERQHLRRLSNTIRIHRRMIAINCNRQKPEEKRRLLAKFHAEVVPGSAALENVEPALASCDNDVDPLHDNRKYMDNDVRHAKERDSVQMD